MDTYECMRTAGSKPDLRRHADLLRLIRAKRKSLQDEAESHVLCSPLPAPAPNYRALPFRLPRWRKPRGELRHYDDGRISYYVERRHPSLVSGSLLGPALLPTREWTFTYEHLEGMKILRVQTIIIRERCTGNEYEATLRDFLHMGLPDKLNTRYPCCGKLSLPIRQMTCRRASRAGRH